MANGEHVQWTLARALSNGFENVFIPAAGMAQIVWDMRFRHNHATQEVIHNFTIKGFRVTMTSLIRIKVWPIIQDWLITPKRPCSFWETEKCGQWYQTDLLSQNDHVHSGTLKNVDDNTGFTRCPKIYRPHRLELTKPKPNDAVQYLYTHGFSFSQEIKAGNTTHY